MFHISAECSICLESIGQHNIVRNAPKEYITCRSKSCTSIICSECMLTYIEYSQENNQIPKCPNTDCGIYYVLSDINKFTELKELYARCCFNELLMRHGEIARKTVEIRNTIETVRQIRNRFVAERFPLAIAYTASLIMPHKLKKLDKQVVHLLRERTNDTHRICMNLTCGGSLGENLVCLSCDTAFCLECEKTRGDNHVCNPDDIESVRSIKQMIHCPNCHLPIIKSEGCNSMTCAHCNENSLYTTGKAGGNGAHTRNTVTVMTKRLLSSIYKEQFIALNVLTLIFNIEALEPKQTDISALTKVLTNYYANGLTTNPQLEMELARSFEQYFITLLANKRYHQAFSEIESRVSTHPLGVIDLFLIYIS